jgi:flagellar protein FliS
MNPSQAYIRTNIETSTPAQLVVMLYDGLIRFTSAAAERIQEQTPESRIEAANLVTRATNILTELNTSLDFSRDEEFCGRMSQLYAFFVERITSALRQSDAKLIEQVLPLMQELRDAWQAAALNVIGEPGSGMLVGAR